MPSKWSPSLARLLPDDVHATGPALARAIAFVVLVIVVARSLVHLLASDGGAERIATIDLDVGGGTNIVALFGQWGAIQLLLAGLLFVLAARYPGLVPLVLLVLLVEPFLRFVSGRLKPVVTKGRAPGARFNFALVPVLVFALYISLCPR